MLDVRRVAGCFEEASAASASRRRLYARWFSLFCLFFRSALAVRPVQSSSGLIASARCRMGCREITSPPYGASTVNKLFLGPMLDLTGGLIFEYFVLLINTNKVARQSDIISATQSQTFLGSQIFWSLSVLGAFELS